MIPCKLYEVIACQKDPIYKPSKLIDMVFLAINANVI